MPEEYRQLVENLPYIRVLCGESTESFANKLGVTRITYQNIENGRKPLTTLYWNAINYLIRTLSASKTAVEKTLFISCLIGDYKVNKLIKKLIDESTAHVSTRLGMKYKQKAALVELEAHRKDIAELLFDSDP